MGKSRWWRDAFNGATVQVRLVVQIDESRDEGKNQGGAMPKCSNGTGRWNPEFS